jgi:hypothetical protein
MHPGSTTCDYSTEARPSFESARAAHFEKERAFTEGAVPGSGEYECIGNGGR